MVVDDERSVSKRQLLLSLGRGHLNKNSRGYACKPFQQGRLIQSKKYAINIRKMVTGDVPNSAPFHRLHRTEDIVGMLARNDEENLEFVGENANPTQGTCLDKRAGRRRCLRRVMR